MLHDPIDSDFEIGEGLRLYISQSVFLKNLREEYRPLALHTKWDIQLSMWVCVCASFFSIFVSQVCWWLPIHALRPFESIFFSFHFISKFNCYSFSSGMWDERKSIPHNGSITSIILEWDWRSERVDHFFEIKMKQQTFDCIHRNFCAMLFNSRPQRCWLSPSRNENKRKTWTKWKYPDTHTHTHYQICIERSSRCRCVLTLYKDLKTQV